MASTYKEIVAGLCLQASDSSALRLGCEVTKVTNGGIGGVDVEAADGFRGVFDHVIITAPLGWLKRNEDVFSPPLAPRISKAIRNLGYGNLDMVFIKFPEAFWNAQVSETNSCHGSIPGKIRIPAFPSNLFFFVPRMQLIQIRQNGGRRSSRSQGCRNRSRSLSLCFSHMANGEGILPGLSEAWRRTPKHIIGSLKITSGRTTPNSQITTLALLNASPSGLCRQTGKAISSRALDLLPICRLDPGIAFGILRR